MADKFEIDVEVIEAHHLLESNHSSLTLRAIRGIKFITISIDTEHRPDVQIGQMYHLTLEKK